MTEQSPEVARRWFRFSLRTLLMGVTVFGIWLGWQMHRRREQLRVAAAVERLPPPHAATAELNMAELEPGHPDELLVLLSNWLNQANEQTGSLLPYGIRPTEWAVRQFIMSWRKPVRSALDSVETSLQDALKALDEGDVPASKLHVSTALQELGVGLRDELGLYDWNQEND